MTPTPRSVRRAALVAAATLCALAATEMFLRVTGLPRTIASFDFLDGNPLRLPAFREDDELFWALDPSSGRYRVGAGGWRGRTPAVPRGPHDVVVACVGDSCVFGSGVRYEETFGVRLERALQRRLPHNRVQSMLAGVPGYSTHQNRLAFDRSVAPLRPDVVVLYCGAWNDAAPAIGLSDAERTARRRSAWYRLRIARLLVGLFDRPSRQEIAITEAAVRAGAPVPEPRVSLVEFERNVEHMVSDAVAWGAAVVVVGPAVSDFTRRVRPVVEEYRAASRAVASRHDAAWVDADALAAPLLDEVPDAFRAMPHPAWPALVDWVHPSGLLHRKIATRVLASLEPALGSWRERAAAIGPSIAIDNADPARLTPPVDNRLVLRGPGLGSAATDAVWLGSWWVSRVRALGADALEVGVPAATPPGDYPVEIVTVRGSVRGGPVTVNAVPLQAALEPAGGAWRLSLAARGRPGWTIEVKISDRVREAPVPTRYGPFWLAADPDGIPPGRTDLPFLFSRLQLLHLQGRFGADGWWRLDTTIDPRGFRDVPDELWLQGLAAPTTSQNHAVITARARIVPPR